MDDPAVEPCASRDLFVVIATVLSGSTSTSALGGSVILWPLMLMVVIGLLHEVPLQLLHDVDEDQLQPRQLSDSSTTELSVHQLEGSSATELPVRQPSDSSASTTGSSVCILSSASPTGLAAAAAGLPGEAVPAAALGLSAAATGLPADAAPAEAAELPSHGRSSPAAELPPRWRSLPAAALLEGERHSRVRLWRRRDGIPPGALGALDVCSQYQPYDAIRVYSSHMRSCLDTN